MSIRLADLQELTFRYCRPWWIERLGLPKDISDEELKVFIRLWNEVNPPDES